MRATFEQAAFREFVNHGWILTLDQERILVGWGEWSEPTEADLEAPVHSLSDCALFLPDFYLTSQQPWRSTRHWDLLKRDQFSRIVMSGVSAVVKPEEQPRLTWQEPEKTSFSASWTDIQSGFEYRGLKKAVPVVFARSRADTASEAFRKSVLVRLCGLPRVLYPYGFWSDNEGLVGATPELLFSQSTESPVLETVALAGTYAKLGVGGQAENLLRDPKERYEHQLVVEDIKECLAKIGDVSVGHIEVMELPTLYHLRTRLQSKPGRAMRFRELVQLLHPTPALGLAPRSLGFEEMKRWDVPEVRSRFGAPFGAQWSGGVHAVVAIRNVQWQEENLQLGSGCGVVPESVFEREWAELALKRDSVKRMLGL